MGGMRSNHYATSLISRDYSTKKEQTEDKQKAKYFSRPMHLVQDSIP